jgi:hypothetical protein
VVLEHAGRSGRVRRVGDVGVHQRTLVGLFLVPERLDAAPRDAATCGLDVSRVSHEGPVGPEDLFHRGWKSEQCRATSAYQRVQPLMSGLAVPFEHLVDRVEIRSDLLSLASA